MESGLEISIFFSIGYFLPLGNALFFTNFVFWILPHALLGSSAHPKDIK
jgi:hypothetical protein